MTIAAIVIAAVFGVATGLFFVLFRRAYASELPFASPLGLPGARVRTNKQVWDASHRRAAPYYAAASAICLIQTLAAAVSLIVPSLMSVGYLVVLAATGLVLVFVLMFLAARP